MQIGSSASYDIGFNYTIPLNDKEVLVVEEDKTRVRQKSDTEKVQDAQKKELNKEETDKKTNPTQKLSVEEQQLVVKLQERDTEVRGHEAAHQAAGGGMTGGASYTYQQGPDGQAYAIGGEVSISTKGASTPQEAIANARQVIAAAMAPGSPSGQDFAVASSARMMQIKAEQQLTKEKSQELLGQETYKNAAQDEDKDVKQDETSLIDVPA